MTTLIPREHLESLNEIDIVLSIYNQERIIVHILECLFKNTLTPFNLILVFDGCTDGTKDIALNYIERSRPSLLKEIIVRETPNIYETRANNVGFRLVRSAYFVTLQDDMAIQERGWEIRLTYPLRAYENVLGVTARIAQDIIGLNRYNQLAYNNRAGRELFSLSRNTFAIRDIVNRGPLAFATEKLRALDFLNEAYAPSTLDDADLALRAFEQRGWVCGAFWIDYQSRPGWSKAKATDSTMSESQSGLKNALKLVRDHQEYLKGAKHSIDTAVQEKMIDYPPDFDRISMHRELLLSQTYFISERIRFFIKRFTDAQIRRISLYLKQMLPYARADR